MNSGTITVQHRKYKTVTLEANRNTYNINMYTFYISKGGIRIFKTGGILSSNDNEVEEYLSSTSDFDYTAKILDSIDTSRIKVIDTKRGDTYLYIENCILVISRIIFTIIRGNTLERIKWLVDNLEVVSHIYENDTDINLLENFTTLRYKEKNYIIQSYAQDKFAAFEKINIFSAFDSETGEKITDKGLLAALQSKYEVGNSF